MSDSLSLGKKISELRKKFGLTQDEFGQKIEVSRQSVANWEKNISAPKSDKILDICRAYDISPNYFYNTEIAATVAENTELRYNSGGSFISALFGVLYFFVPVACLSVFVISAILLWSGSEFRESDTGKGFLMALTVLAAILFVCIIILIIQKVYAVIAPNNESK